MATAIPSVVDAADAAGYGPGAQAGAAELASSLDLLATTIGEQHLAMSPAARDEVLAAYRRHHGLFGRGQARAS